MWVRRISFQDMAAEGLIISDELRGKLAIPQRDYTWAEPEACLHRKEKMSPLEADAEKLLCSYACAIASYIRSLDAQEQHRVYELQNLGAAARSDGGLGLSGALGEIGSCVKQTQLHS